MLNNAKQFSHKDFGGLTQKIGKMFDKYNEKRHSQLDDIKAVQDKVYGLNLGSEYSWESHLELPNVYEQHQTLKAHLIDSIYTNPEGLFDVTTANADTQQIAVKQKIMLTDALEKMKIGEQIEKIIDNIIETGECTLFVGWETRYKTIRRAVEAVESDLFVYEKKKIFEGTTVKTIAPQDFVFDAAQKNNWNACPKIFRTYLTLDEIKSDSNNIFLNAEIEKELANCVSANKERENTAGFKNGQIEILEFWGDIELEDNKLFKNYFAVCAGRQAIIRFEPNPFVNSPFIYANLIENPTTKRGISPLKSILPLNAVATKVLNNQLDAYSLIVNPPYLAPRGAFKGEQVVSPGKIIEYDSSLLPQMPTALNFTNALSGWDFVEYFKNSIEGTTGIYRTMAGSIAQGNRTATELNYSANGQNARLNLAIDTINRKLLLPMVEKIADTIANFKFENELITRKINDKPAMFEITNEIRGGDYIYRYSDRKASTERKWRQKELGDIIANFAKIPDFANKINWKECFKLALEQLGVENCEKFLNEK